jgi:hypothetical protein
MYIKSFICIIHLFTITCYKYMCNFTVVCRFVYIFNILLISCKIAQPNGTKPGSDDSWKEEIIIYDNEA